jgi:hypothetical protein
MNQDDTTEAVEPGSVPLKSLKYELYCQQRALNCSAEIAAQRAGYPARSGAHTRIERLAEVQLRLAFLRRDEDELIRQKRRRIEEELNTVVDFDVTEFALINEETGALQSIDWRKVRDSGMSRAVSEFAFDPKTGELTKFKRDDRLNAISQLRDMYGFKAVQKISPTNPEGDGPATMFVDVSDNDRLKALSALLAKHRAKDTSAS